MGVNSRRPLLPAPTESIVDTTGSSITNTDMATDVSRRTDKSSYSLPDDGSPITISTRRRSHKKDEDDSSKLSRSSHQSQTSLLIEYFEREKSSSRLHSRPSVRVKVIPSGRKGRDHGDTIRIREGSSSSKRPQYSRRISVSTPSKQKTITDGNDDKSITDEEQDGRPLEIEFRENTSDLSNDRYIQPTSEISSMPADSMLDGSMVSKVPQRKRSQSLDKTRDIAEADLLKAPSRRRSRSLSRERIAKRVAQKLNAGDLLATETKLLKKRSHKQHEDDQPSIESSLLSGSNVSSHHKSGDAISFRSNTSKSSLNNTRFLETVEDAIRRLILPELKELKKDQKVSVNKTKFERDTIDSAGASSKDVPKRRLSKHSSAPDVSKSSLSMVNVDKEEAITPEERRRRHKERRREKQAGSASPEESLRVRKGSLPSNQRAFTEEEVLRRQRSKGLRDAAAAGIVGSALTAAALKHHDSKSSLDRRPRKRKSKGSSRSASIHDSDTELLFQKHNVPPMPFRSDIETELTRDSILSQRTADTETPVPREVQEVIRGSPRGAFSPTPRTPTRTPIGGQRELDSRQSDHVDHQEIYDRDDTHHDDVLLEGAGGAIAAAAAGNLLGHNMDQDMLGPNNDIHHPRALSPIQSVASDHDLHEAQPEEEREDDDRRYSIQSLSSAPSTELARSTRPEAISLESRSEILKQHDEPSTELGYETSRDIDDETSVAGLNETSQVDELYEHGDKNFTDGDVDYSDEDEHHTEYRNSPRQLTRGAAINPQFVSAVGIESAVGSLMDPSVLDTRSGLSQAPSQADSLNRSINGNIVEETQRSLPASSRRGSPLKHEYDLNNHDEKSFTKRLGASSPPQSVTQSEEDSGEHDERFPLNTTIMEDSHRDITPEEDDYLEEESELTTNPSIIQGPIGSVPHESRDHWPYNNTPSQARELQSTSQHDTNPAAAAAIGGALGAGLGLAAAEPKSAYDQTYDQGYMSGHMFSTPPGAKDEGYISAANPMSPSNASPEPRNKFSTLDHANPPLLFDDRDIDEDPFTGPGHQRHFSGYSHGMASPIYDSATGRGIDSIESKDIIALMNHLTVRDAQRNARDTEILVTLVRSAAEMRSSFLEMKKYIAEQDDMLLQANEKQHERTRAIGGPRPLPASRSNRQLGAAEYGEEAQAKRRNVFRRALKSLSTKSSNDLTKIEDMLEQLLDEVEALRAAQDGRTAGPAVNTASFNSTGNGGAYTDGYEPEGQAGTGSPGEHSGYTSNSSRPLADIRPTTMRRPSENRISTVPEGDEEEIDTYEQPLLERDVPYDDRVVDERSVPEHLGTPPRKPVPAGSGSQETTPRKSEEKSRKHKSSNSSFFKISRWSKTTASTVGEGIRNSMQPSRKERPSSEMSRSGSDLANQDHYNTGGFYDPHGDDRLRSDFTVDEEQQDNRPPSPLVPSQVSEGPKYKAHRDSLNLQHPQPQKGPTDRYQNHLEYQAQDYAPTSPTSERWGSQSSLPNYGANTNRYSNGNPRLTPISDAGYSEVSSSRGPPRPPKIKDAGPLVPNRPPKIKEDEKSGSIDRVAGRSNHGNGSPSNQPPHRKPTGPRPITSSGQYSPSNIKRQQYRGSPNRIDYDDDKY